MALKFLFQKVLKDAALLNIAASVNKRSREYFISRAKELDNQRPNRILDRKDINQQYVSWRNLMNYLLNDDRYPEWTETKINFGERFFWLQKYLIRQISSKYNLKLYFYEDIFFNNYSTVFDELNIDLDLVDTRYLDPQFKYKENVFKPELPKQLI